MTRFLSRHPGLVLLAIISVATAGVVLAHRDKERPKIGLSVKSAKAERLRKEERIWRAELDLEKARNIGGKLVQTLQSGTKVAYTLLPRLQQDMTHYLAQYKLPYAGAVAIAIPSGKVLAMVGHSEENAKLGARRLCLSPWAPAASVFKVITTGALLARGVPASTTTCYHGGFRGLQSHHLESQPGRDTSCRTLSDALAKSINPIMAKLALHHLGRDTLSHWAKRFGFNRDLSFEFPVERSRASIPSARLEFARTAAGFWHTEISVLHGAMIASVPAAGGKMIYPHVVESLREADGSVVDLQRRSSRRVLPSKAAKQLASMMVRTTTHGSGRKGFFSKRGKPFLPIAVGGKTGSLARRKPFLHYSWFVGFAPAKKPEIAFAVLLGNPARWRIKASTAARKLVSLYLDQKKRTSTKKGS